MNSIELLEKFGDNEVRIYRDDEGTCYVHMMDLAKLLMLPKNSSDVLSKIFSEYRFKFSAGNVGQPAWWVNEYGVHQMIFASQHPKAIKIQKWMFEEVLPKLKASGYYISPDATSEQLRAMSEEINLRNRLIFNASRFSKISEAQWSKWLFLCCPDFKRQMHDLWNCTYWLRQMAIDQKLKMPVTFVDWCKHMELFVEYKQIEEPARSIILEIVGHGHDIKPVMPPLPKEEPSKINLDPDQIDDIMDALNAANEGNLYQLLGESRDREPGEMDSRLKYLAEAGLSAEKIASLHPVPMKQGFVGWFCCGKYAEQISKELGVKFDPGDERQLPRAVIGKEKYLRRLGEFQIKVEAFGGRMTIKDFCLKMVELGYAVYAW